MDALVDTLAVGSLAGATLLAPNAVGVIGRVYLRHQTKRQREREMQSILRYMKRQELIDIVEDGGTVTITMTVKGELRRSKFQFENMRIAAPDHWDGKWRIVMFDVPEKYRMARRVLSEKLRDTGFRLLQKSAWVHPFDCREQIELIKYCYPEIAPFVILLEVDNIDTHNELVKSFKNILP